MGLMIVWTLVELKEGLLVGDRDEVSLTRVRLMLIKRAWAQS